MRTKRRLAASVAWVDSLAVYQWVEAGTIHFAETEAGAPLLCAVSLGRMVQTRKDEPIQIRLSPT